MATLSAITPPGGAEWLIILAVVVLLFGAKKLPELGSSVGKSIRNFKRGIDESHEEADETTEQAAASAQDGSSDAAAGRGRGEQA